MFRTWWGWIALTVLLLWSLGLILLPGRNEHPVSSPVKAIVDSLDKACQTYKLEYGVYPPGSPDFDSRILYRCLGSNRKIRKGDVEEDAPPILQFPQDWIEKGQIVDPWDQPVRYRNPGIFNRKGVDIWSLGKNGKEELVPDGKDSDDITNWVKEY